MTSRTGWRRYAERHPRRVDTVLVALLCAISGPAAFYSSVSYTPDLSGWWVGVLAAVASLALLWRRSLPGPVVAVTAMCAGASAGIGCLLTPLLLAPVMVALYELSTRSSRRTAALYCAGCALVIIPAAFFGHRAAYPWPLTTINPALCLLLPVVIGSTARLRAAYLEAVEARAEYAEKTREDEARHRVAEERLRIARELHDVVAHHLTLASAQATTGAYLARTGTGDPERFLTELSATTTTALRELKATVGLLRQDDASPEQDSPLEPAPGLDRLADLTGSFAAAGLDVGVRVDGTPRPLSPGIDLTAYRIIQEALTNVAKHAATTTATVRLTYGADRLTLAVTNGAAQDDGPVLATAAPGRGGFGLIGMRERARTAGGTLHAGPDPGGGYTVTAELPIHTT
ncbi:signal transduction histidine kinase [Actinocorallia herbida]|uniref:histidine kinase n=1 Tax=Actinocorallia herbida TaxID=58109 RepID=A0A3N1D1T2_9ACTN|nr:sensor histidine kinase [Actinocorallia herbida]ROO87440.1 signal transduction histidine kinase [Actinocorallia herbida]